MEDAVLPMRDGNLRAIITERLKGAHVQAIETGGVGAGVPDLNFCIPLPTPTSGGWRGIEGWIECKRGEGVNGNIVKVRPHQIAWIERRARAGGRVFVAVRRRPLAQPRTDELWLLGPGHVRATRLIPEASLGHWAGGPARWDWAEIAVILTG